MLEQLHFLTDSSHPDSWNFQKTRLPILLNRKKRKLVRTFKNCLDCKSSPLQEQFIAKSVCRRSSAADRLLWQLQDRMLRVSVHQPCGNSPCPARFCSYHHPSALAQTWDCHHSYCQGDLQMSRATACVWANGHGGPRAVLSQILCVRGKGGRSRDARDALQVNNYICLLCWQQGSGAYDHEILLENWSLLERVGSTWPSTEKVSLATGWSVW